MTCLRTANVTAIPALEEPAGAAGRRLTTGDLRGAKHDRDRFLSVPRRPITVVLDGVRQNYNLGAIFRLADAFLIQRLVVGGMRVDLRHRRLVQAARGTIHWVPWSQVDEAATAVREARLRGEQIVVVEQTTHGVAPQDLAVRFPVCIVFGSERAGVSSEVIAAADAAVTIPMFGMANSINVSTAAAIVLHSLSVIEGSRRSVLN